MSTNNITAVLMDVKPVDRSYHIDESYNTLDALVLNKPLLDHHLEALQAQGIDRVLVLSDRISMSQYRSKGAAFKADHRIKSSMTSKELGAEHYLFLPANVYMDFDLEYFINSHLQAKSTSSQVAPLGKLDRLSSAFFSPVLLQGAIVEDLFTQITQLTVDTLRVFLSQYPMDLSVPTQLLSSAISTPVQKWTLHQKLYRSGKAFQAPVGFQYQENVWAGTEAKIHPDIEVNGLVIAGDRVTIHSGAKFKGLVVLGDDVIIEKGAVIEHSMIENDTYVGRLVRIENSVVHGQRLHRIDRGLILDINEKPLLGSTRFGSGWFSRHRNERRTARGSWHVSQAG